MSYSRVESDRFQLSVHRFKYDEVDRDALREIRAAKPDIAIVRIPSEKVDQVARLELYGVAPLVTDTLVYYGRDLSESDLGEIRNRDLEFRLGSDKDRDRLSHLIGEIFAGYRNHYAGNPILPGSEILDGFVEWGLSYLQEDEDYICWVLYDGERPVAFANCKRYDDCLEGVLFGVSSEYSGRGIYGDLMTFTQRDAIRRDCTRMIVSTQIQNLAVQKAWVRRGFRLYESWNTVHLNLLMSDDYSLAVHKERILLDESLVSRYGHVTGDENPVHFDDAAAVEQGFDRRIAHGALLNGLVSRAIGMKLPGKGTIYLWQGASYLKPVYLDTEVALEIWVKHVNRKTGRILASTRVYNAERQLVFVGVAVVLNSDFVNAL
jgi:3-hydroxybutyryl-CoA dehydratase